MGDKSDAVRSEKIRCLFYRIFKIRFTLSRRVSSERARAVAVRVKRLVLPTCFE